MVWFQCEDCGENLKKPKLPNHFRICSATKLSCIDCGEVFGQQSVQGHTQCISEAEKYGPKGQGKALNGTTPKPNKESKQKPDVDINVGLSERPPWFCSLCNTNATSKQTLLLHADGKKHRAKVRAFNAKQQIKHTEESASDLKAPTENASKNELLNDIGEPKVQYLPKPVTSHVISNAENGNLPSNRKRKHDESDNDGTRKKFGGDTDEAGDGKVIQVEKIKGEEKKSRSKKANHEVQKENKMVKPCSSHEDIKEKTKWKKLITSALKSNEGVLKMRKLRKLVLKSLQESGIMEDKAQLCEKLEHKINSSSRFTVDGKYVRLMATDRDKSFVAA